MDKDEPILHFETIMHSNRELLNLAREEKWDEFIDTVEDYIICLSGFIEKRRGTLNEENKQALEEALRLLQENEKEMTKRLRSRLDFLTQKMSSLQQGKKCAQAYSTQITQSLH